MQTLTPMCSVASVVKEDGRTYDIAKIAGSVFYRDTMDAAGSMPSDIEVIPSEIPDVPPGEPEMTCGNMYDDVYEIRMPAPIGLQTIYDQLTPWLGGYAPDVATKALTDMLLCLKMATESALRTKIQQVYITVPVPVDHHFTDRLLAASTAVGIKTPVIPISGPMAAVKAYGLVHECPQNLTKSTDTTDPEQLILVIDYTRQALIATLTIADCSFKDRRFLFSFEFGARELAFPALGIDSRRATAKEQQLLENERRRSYSNLVDALRRLTVMPVKGVRIEEHTRLDHILIVSDHAEDKKLRSALQEVFGEQLETLLHFVGREYGSVDPAYAAAQYAALSSLNNTSV